MVSHIEVLLAEKPITPKNIDEYLKGPKGKLLKEDLFVKYDKNKNVSLLSDPIPIKSLPDGTKLLRSLIYPSIKEDKRSDAWKVVACNCENGSSHIQDINFDKSYSPVVHYDPSKINIAIVSMHIIIAMILDVINLFQNKNVPINEIVCVSPPPYYLDWFEKAYPNVTFNRYDGPFCLQYMTGIQGTKPAGQKWN